MARSTQPHLTPDPHHFAPLGLELIPRHDPGLVLQRLTVSRYYRREFEARFGIEMLTRTSVVSGVLVAKDATLPTKASGFGAAISPICR